MTSPYDLLMPTHAMLARAATSPGPRAVPARSTSIQPESLLKYIIVAPVPGLELAVLFHPSIQHSNLVDKPSTKPISAGFCRITESGVEIDPLLGSTSLNLKPRPEDAALIQTTLKLLHLQLSV